jgi:ABC-type glycerol-3-phosphate transport system permease component
MKRIRVTGFLILFCALFAADTGIFAQQGPEVPVKSQEISEVDGVPVLIKHLPDWENILHSAKLAHSPAELKANLGDRPILGSIEFKGGNEAVIASYPQGKLLVVEFASPQSSADLDEKVKQQGADGAIYRRIGNYNAFVFDATDEAAANALLDQVKFEKNIQWLGDNPFAAQRAHQAERNFVTTTADIFFSTLLAIVTGLGVSILIGILAGFAFFYFREKGRAELPTYTDAGGMTRLNLDGFTPDIAPDRLLKD